MAKRKWEDMSERERLVAAGFKPNRDEPEPKDPIQQIVDKGWNREELERRVNEKKERAFADRVKGYNNRRAEKATAKASIRQLQWALSATEQEWEDALEDADIDTDFLYYH